MTSLVSLPVEALHTTFKGIVTGERVVQYRGIKFASIAKRFARSELVTGYDEVVDATVHGPGCPSQSYNKVVVPGVSPEQFLLAVPAEQCVGSDLDEDEFECLRLIITVPKDLPTDGSKLPVFVNLPGGGNIRAPTGVKVFDYTRLVETSLKLNKPIIAVHVPYRVGFLGYGIFPNGVGGNNTLFDQRNAFEWIKRNISHFGGDPDNITAAGESAGGFSIDCHLRAKGTETDKGLQYFKRAIMKSGTLNVLAPKTVVDQIELAKKAANSIGFDGEDWVEKFAAASVNQLIEGQLKVGISGMHPVDDGEWFEPGKQEFTNMVVPSWCESLMIGDCAFEGALWAQRFMNTPAEMIIRAMETFGPTGQKLLELYPGLKYDAPGVPLITALNLLHDIFFSYPAYFTAKAWKDSGKQVYEYAFDQVNPWDAKRQAHHAADLLYWFNGYDLPTPADQAVSDDMQARLIAFVRGEAPWSASSYYAFGPGGPTGGEITAAQFSERRRVQNFTIFDQFGYRAIRDVGNVDMKDHRLNKVKISAYGTYSAIGAF